MKVLSQKTIEMKSNKELQKDVQDAINWEPLLTAAQIGVTAIDGVITLTGTVDSYTKKIEAEDAAKSVAGVKAVVEKIEIKFFSLMATRDDSEIATEVINAFKMNGIIPGDKVKVKVEGGWVTIDGELDWNYQKESAQNTVKNLFGVKGVTNNIKIKPDAHDVIEKKHIKNALNRNWSIDANEIEVEVLGNTVTLSGIVDSAYQKDEAGKIAWKAPGVFDVKNNLVVEYDYAFAD